MSAITAQQRLHLRKLIADLKSHKALHTEFVSVYIPKDYDIIKIIQHLAEEQGTASNIKSASTRKNVQSALEKMIQHLRLFPKTPPNGLAAFAGNVAAVEGKQDLRAWSIEPPIPLNIRIYRCDKNFVTDILEEMMAEKSVYGLVVLDSRDANLALLKGKTIIPIKKTHSEVPGKMKAGGQCLLPQTKIGTKDPEILRTMRIGDKIESFDFEKNKIIESNITDKWNVKKCEFLEIITSDNTKTISSRDHLFFTKNQKEKPGEELSLNDCLLKISKGKSVLVKIKSIKNIKRKINLIDISVGHNNFIANGLIVHNSAHRFAQNRENALLDHFKKIAEYMKDQFLPLGNDLKGIIIGGPGTTINDFINKDLLTGDIKKKVLGTKDLSYTGDFGLQELLEKSEDILAEEEVAQEKKLMQRFFKQMMENPKKVTYGEKETLRAMEMKAVDTLLVSENIPEDRIFELEELANKGGANIRIISVETREGIQLKELGGIAAILRFEMEPI